ncbi:ABC transporter ATP-binding protein [Phycisphaera mikurensis]|uniref:Putative ABC transporter ATP-binding protein n=1 Tax=Phycisphaera mikurensis (strain NBRC 102666 / KCTC 22515 / FYK2301M01) TaxID=1142394 RepID=I0IFY1_PHYMF|nr:ABC transporter ATP-binding protein [Phycisphaera mikurensis]MBB6440444.1 sodium transport system ATP-binding protein [Phycisphaera mikurensis]BAM04169.1 putative ABC transporter ATP-binding protein [Phycisphaera mikurensis NBRC 102666]
MLAVDQLVKAFPTGEGPDVLAVQGVSFSVAAGECYGLLGPNGAGKTTLLRMIATLVTPTSGHAAVDGFRGDERPERLRSRLGFMSGNTRLYRRLTGRELLAYFGRLNRMSEPRIRERTAELSAAFGLGEFLDRRCGGYSTGQAQRVSIARVMLHEPPLLILDEPTLGLDVMSARAMLDFVERARDAGTAIVFSTHHMSEAEQLCTRVGFLYRGRLLAEDTPARLCTAAGTSTLRDAFLAMADAADADEAPA